LNEVIYDSRKRNIEWPPVAETCRAALFQERINNGTGTYMSRTYVEADSVSFFFNQRGTGTALILTLILAFILSQAQLITEQPTTDD
jgi:hypothetical protein